MKTTYIFGCGAHGRTVLDILRAAGAEDVCFIDDSPQMAGLNVNGITVFGSLEKLSNNLAPSDNVDTGATAGFLVALGRPQMREAVAKKIEAAGLPFANAVHPQAFVAASAEIGVGNMIAAQAVVNSNARLGNHIIVNTGVVLEHDDSIEDYATICPGAQVGGRVHLGKGAFVGTGAIILPRLRIGEGAVVGAGALVTHDVEPHTLVYGSPARFVGKIDKDFDFGRLF